MILCFDFFGDERGDSSQHVYACVAGQCSQFVGGEQFSAVPRAVYCPASVCSFGLACCSCVYGGFAQSGGYPFGCCFFVSAQEEGRVAVSCQGFPLFFVQGFQLREVLYDYACRY